MHIPDGFLDLPTAATTSAGGLLLAGAAIRKVNRSLSPERIPLMGLAAAFLFTAQLISIPVPGGTSTHLLGAVLLTALLGPASGIVILTTVLLLQAFLFQHGGLTTLGANLLNVGGIGCLLGSWIIQWSWGSFERRLAVAILITLPLGGLATAVELSIAGTTPWRTGIPAMTLAAGITAILEAMATLALVRLLSRIRPDLLDLEKI